VRAFVRRRKKENFQISKEGKQIKIIKVALFTDQNKIIKHILNDIDVRQDILDTDEELDLEIAGKTIKTTSTLLVNSKNNLCYNFTEYEIKKNREGKIIPCETCGEIFCEHRIKKQAKSNVDLDKQPVRWISTKMIDKLEAIKTWSFSDSYQIRHVDGLTYQLLYDMAKSLHDLNKVVLMAPIENKKPQRIVLKKGGRPFYGWLEGRIEGDKYALILHRTTLKLVD
jgi:hypothetical protein